MHQEKCRICVRCHTAFDVKIIDVFGIQSISGITADQNWKERYLPNEQCDFDNKQWDMGIIYKTCKWGNSL